MTAPGTLHYLWTINKFSSRLKETRLLLKTPTFIPGIKWYLQLSHDCSDEASKDYITLIPRLVLNCTTEVSAIFTLVILNAKKERTDIVDSHKVSYVQNFDLKTLVRCDKLLDKASGILCEDKLYVWCEISDIKFEKLKIAKDNFVHFEAPSCTLSNDLHNLFDNPKFSDVTLVVSSDNREFQSHKNILGTRSPVFAAMFEHKMDETKSNRVTITDIDYDVLFEMLRYIYTGKTPELRDLDKKWELLAAADKYCLESLKEMCEESIFFDLSVETAAETLILSDFHSVNKLKAKAISFIIENKANVLKTDGWQNMVNISQHTKLLAELFAEI